MAKIDISDVKRGTILNVEGQLLKVTETSHTHMGRGGANYVFKVKNIVTGATTSLTNKGGVVLEKADVSTQNGTYLYNAWGSYSFMENDTGEIFEINEDSIEDSIPYLKENLNVYMMIFKGNVIGILLPPTISYKIIETVPGIKGDRAQAGKKPAKLETWLEVQVALHKSEGDLVTVNTETGEAM